MIGPAGNARNGKQKKYRRNHLLAQSVQGDSEACTGGFKFLLNISKDRRAKDRANDQQHKVLSSPKTEPVCR